jgi:hypothetical protein
VDILKVAIGLTAERCRVSTSETVVERLTKFRSHACQQDASVETTTPSI